MDAAYARQYRELYRRHWWWRARERLIVATLRSQAPARGWPSILDVGCGDGLFFERLREFGSEVEGVESDASLVDPTGPWASRIRIQPFDETFQPGHRYGLITMLDVLEHLPDPGAALCLAASLLESDGLLCVTVPAFAALWTDHDDINHHLRRFTSPVMIRLAGEAGLDTRSTRYFFFWTCPVKLLIRFKERVLGWPSAIAKVPTPLANHAFYALSVIEQQSLGRLPIPFGSSLLFLGRRQ
jgi:SAM-dependent methyltransferase